MDRAFFQTQEGNTETDSEAEKHRLAPTDMLARIHAMVYSSPKCTTNREPSKPSLPSKSLSHSQGLRSASAKPVAFSFNAFGYSKQNLKVSVTNVSTQRGGKNCAEL